MIACIAESRAICVEGNSEENIEHCEEQDVVNSNSVSYNS
jgi:hypothetical protein